MTLKTRIFVLALFVSPAALAAAASPSGSVMDGESLLPWSANTHPTDVAKSHVEEITATAATHRYTVVQGGTMDGRNCRLPMGCGIAREGALLQAWESN